jgi:hypothetical protein
VSQVGYDTSLGKLPKQRSGKTKMENFKRNKEENNRTLIITQAHKGKTIVIQEQE